MLNFNSRYTTNRLSSFPFFLRYIGPSLIERGKEDNWFENRFLFSVYTTLSFIERYEKLLSEANCLIDLEGLLRDLKSGNIDYDLKIFDMFSEIRSVIWANINGFRNITKIPRATYKTPDFSMTNSNGKTTLMETKNKIGNNPFHTLANDRAKGLLLVNGLTSKIGLNIDETDKYLRYQHKILAIRNIYNILSVKMRNQLTHDVICQLADGKITYISLLNNLLKITANEYVEHSVTSISNPHHPPNPVDTLNKLVAEIDTKKEQFNEYIRAIDNEKAKDISDCIVFVTGISNEQPFWWLLSEELRNSQSDIWKEINRLFTNETAISTRIISNFGTIHDIYHDFPRNYSEYSIIYKEYISIVSK
jgi:hypothetical protein